MNFFFFSPSLLFQLIQYIFEIDARTLDALTGLALLINFSVVPRGAEQICGSKGEGLSPLMKRAHQSGDPLLMKVLRNASFHESSKPFFVV